MASYINTMEAKEDFSEIINRVAHNKEHIILTRRGKEIAVIIPFEDLAIIEQTQNKNDLHEAVEALREARSLGTINLKDLKAEIG